MNVVGGLVMLVITISTVCILVGVAESLEKKRKSDANEWLNGRWFDLDD